MTTWFITGTSSGFGRLLTEHLLERGDRVAATLRRPEVLDPLRDRYGEQLWVAALDVTDPDAIGRVVDEAFAALGTIDVVVNNAGYGVFAAVEEVSDAQIRAALDTNLLGPIRVTRAALPHLRAQGGGRILQVSSAGGQTTYPNFSVYHAAKWGLEGFSETVAQEVAGFGVHLTIVEPGATSTGFADAVASAAPMPEYADSPAAAVRRMVEEGQLQTPNDPARIVDAMIDLVESGATPLRLPLGSDTFEDVRRSLTDRLAALDAARDVAYSVVAR